MNYEHDFCHCEQSEAIQNVYKLSKFKKTLDCCVAALLAAIRLSLRTQTTKTVENQPFIL